jgi:hypothetical protein
MTARETFQFDQKYTLRPARLLSDYALALDWTEADPDHAGKVDPQFWLEQGEGKDAYLFSDDKGPLFFFKMVIATGSAVEIHIQFPPNRNSAHQRQRIARGLLQGIAWLERVLAHCQIREMFFDSINSSLIGFSIKRLGFQFIGGKLRKMVAA